MREILHVEPAQKAVKACALCRGPPASRAPFLRYGPGWERVITDLQRVSKPGCRIYCGKGEIPRVYGGLGINILSTSRGVMTGREAAKTGVGGEILCNVW